MTKLFTILCIAVSFSAFAQSPESCETILTGSDTQLANQHFANYVAHYDDGLGVRGFMGGGIPNTPANVQLAMKYGLIWWGMKWNFAESLEEAIAHRLRVRRYHEAKKTEVSDLLMAGQYIIGSEAELGLSFSDKDKQLPVPAEKIVELISRGAWEIDHLGNAVFVTPERLARRVSLSGMIYAKVDHLPATFGKNSISQGGWVAFKQHGLHDYSTWKNSSEAKKLRKLARGLADRSWTVRFDVDYELMLNKIKNQIRSYRQEEVNEDGVLVKGERKDHELHMSRYSKPEVFNSMLALLNSGQGYSVGLYNESGELMGGEIGVRDGNHLYGDSVFYDGEVDYAKIAALALFDVLDAHGMPYSDPGMITPYTASMGAELVPFPEYLQKIKSGPAARIDLPAQWDPRTPADLDAAFSELAKKKSQGLGNVKLVRRAPIVAGGAALAAKVGMAEVELKVVIVKNFSEAQADVQTRAWADLPVYLLTQAPVEGSTLEFLRNALAGEARAFVIPSSRHPEAQREVPLKQLKDVLELNVEAQAPHWAGGAHLPTVVVKGWGFKPAERR